MNSAAVSSPPATPGLRDVQALAAADMTAVDALIRKRLKKDLITGAVTRNAHGRARSPIEGWKT